MQAKAQAVENAELREPHLRLTDKFLEQFLEDTDPLNVLYHYTSMQSALSIVNSEAVWASRTDSLNDASEFSHARTVVCRALSNYLGIFKISDTGKRSEFDKELAERLKVGKSVFSGITVFSLSEEANDLGQWRAYGHDGRGIAIGFRADLLEYDGQNAGYVLGKCLYD